MTSAASPLAGVYNFRDLGGLPLRNGGETRSQVLFRSDALATLTPRGVKQLSRSPIGAIVDFRTESERETAPDRLPTDRELQTVELSILGGSMADMAKTLLTGDDRPDPAVLARAVDQVPTLGQMYLSILQGGGASFARVARLISQSRDDSPTAVLVHCTAGKDRTGVASALMLDAVGVERDAIVADYAASQQNLAGDWAEGMLGLVSSLGIPLTPALKELITGTPPEAIEQALAWIDDEFGDSAAYLTAGGLETADLSALRSRLAGG